MRKQLLVFCLFLLPVTVVFAQDSLTNADTVNMLQEFVQELESQPVDSVPILTGIGPYTIDVRNQRIKDKIEAYRGLTFTPIINVIKNDETNDLVIGETLIMTVTKADADALGLSLIGATEFYLDALNISIQARAFQAKDNLLINIAIAALILIVFFIGLKFYNRLFRLLYLKIHSQKGKLIKDLKFRNYEYLSDDKMANLFII